MKSGLRNLSSDLDRQCCASALHGEIVPLPGVHILSLLCVHLEEPAAPRGTMVLL